MESQLSIRGLNESFVFRHLNALAFEYAEADRCRELGFDSSAQKVITEFVGLANMMCFALFKLTDFRLNRFLSEHEWEGKFVDNEVKSLSGFLGKGWILPPNPQFDYNPLLSAFYSATDSAGVNRVGFPPVFKKVTSAYDHRMNSDFLYKMADCFSSLAFKQKMRVRLEKANRCIDKCVSHAAQMVRSDAARILKINFYLIGLVSFDGQLNYVHDVLAKIFGKFANTIFKTSSERHGVSGYMNFSRLSRARGLYYHCIFFVDISFARTDDYLVHYLGNLWKDLARRQCVQGCYDTFPIYQQDAGYGLRYISGKGRYGPSRQGTSTPPSDGSAARNNAKLFREYLEYLAFANFIMCVNLEPRARLFSTTALGGKKASRGETKPKVPNSRLPMLTLPPMEPTSI